MLLNDILGEEYALCLSCGFFRFYAHMGVLHALEENNSLNVKSCSGSSAGALVAGFLASGMKPRDMPDRVFSIKRENIWDVGIGLGLLKGQLFQEILEKQFPVQTFEECPIPLGVTAYDLIGFKTNCITSGNLPSAVRASCTFPGLFQPVVIDGRLHIDGGVWDDGGLMALPSVPPSNLIVNIVCGRGRIRSSVLPDKFKDARLLTLVLDNIPMVSPYNMEKTGPLAFKTSRAATFRMLRNGHLQQLSHNHWCAYIDGSGDLPLSSTTTDITENLIPIPRAPHSLSSVNLHVLEIDDGNEIQRPIKRHSSFQFHDKSWDSVSGLNSEGLNPHYNVITSVSSSGTSSGSSSGTGSRSNSTLSSSSSSSSSSNYSCRGSRDYSVDKSSSSSLSNSVESKIIIDAVQLTTTLEGAPHRKDKKERVSSSSRNTRSRTRMNDSTMSAVLGSPTPVTNDITVPSAQKQTRKRSLSSSSQKVETSSHKAVRSVSRRAKKECVMEVPYP